MEVHKEIGTIKDKYFVITGTLSRFKRDTAIELIEDKGGVVEMCVTHKTDYLVVGAVKYETRKMKAAKKYDVTVIHEGEFYEMLSLDNYTQLPIQDCYYGVQ